MDQNAQQSQQQVSGQVNRPMNAPPARLVQQTPQQDAVVPQQDASQASQQMPPQEQPQEEEPQQVVAGGGHPEQGSIAVVENDDKEEEERQVAPQEVKIQSSHQKEVVLPNEVKEAGVEQTDKRKQELEQQMEEENVILGNEVSPTPTASAAQPLPMSYEEAMQTQQTNQEAKNPNNAFAWFLTGLIRMWKKVQGTSHTQ